MVMAATLSERLGLIDSGFVKRLTRLIQRAHLPTRGPNLGAERYLELMRIDKKSEGGEIKFVLINRPGSATVRAAPDALVAEMLGECCTAS